MEREELKSKVEDFLERLKSLEEKEERMMRIFVNCQGLIRNLEEYVVELGEESEHIEKLEGHIEKILTALGNVADQNVDELNRMFKKMKEISREELKKIEWVQKHFVGLYNHICNLREDIEEISKKKVSEAKLKEIRDLIKVISFDFEEVMKETKNLRRDIDRLAA